ncbi:MAG: MerR family transcriptional regulator [Eubacteriaceae bacterium]|nr:MerR family transcriptional regulator [Eubacteriaceae bacterium]
MKMRQLKERLARQNANVSERMVKYYIETGLIPPPDYTQVNQAEYSDIHYVRLLRIDAMKKAGMGFSGIRSQIETLDGFIRQMAEKKGITYEEAANLPEVISREYCEYMVNYPGEESYTKSELIEQAFCEKMVFDLAVDTGVLEDKELYSASDRLILLCINNLFLYSDSSGGSDVIERISEISKINNIANSLAAYYSRNSEKTWIYKNLTESIIRGKLEKKWQQNRN